MLICKMISILTTANKDNQLTSEPTDITFENLLIFLATISNIEVPYKDSIKQAYMSRNNFNDTQENNGDLLEKNSSEIPFDNGDGVDNINDKSYVEMKMSQSNLLNLLPARDTQPIVTNSDFIFPLIFSESEQMKIKKEFVNFASNRREFITNQKKYKVRLTNYSYSFHEFKIKIS